MKDNRFYANFLISNEMLDRYPTSMQIALKDIGERLTEKLFCEIQKGEKIVCLKDATTNDYPLNMTELKQELCIIDLVRCKDCKFNYANQIPGDDDTCQLCVELPISKDFFCAYGEKNDETN